MNKSAPLALTALLLLPSTAPRAQQDNGGSGEAVLRPTNHPRLPADPSRLWMVPATPRPSTGTGGANARAGLAEAIRLEGDADFADALPILLGPAVREGVLGGWARYYQGLAELGLGRAVEARQTFQALQAQAPIGYLSEAAALGEAESDEALGDQAAALDLYVRLSRTMDAAPDELLMRIGRAAKALGRSGQAADAFSRVVYEFPFSDLAAAAASELEPAPIAPGTTRYTLELGRAERLFGAKRYSQARPLYETLGRAASGGDRELFNLRLAECDYFLKRPRSARDLVRPYVDNASRQGEALYFYAVSVRELGADEEYLRTIRRIVDEFPDESWAEEALNNLASYHVVRDEDESADAAFREMYEKYPRGRYAERAAWKIGWWAYRNGSYAETTGVFESAAARFPRSDYRPAWLYWSARAHDRLEEPSLADARYVLVATDYLNSYYGRLALTRLDGRAPERRLVAGSPPADSKPDDAPPPYAPLPPNEPIVRALLGLELYAQAIDELRYAQKTWGDSPAIQATLAWAYNRRGDLRAGINAVKRAYPQYMAAGGEQLPRELLRVLYPVDYWPLIRRYAQARDLDPYLMAALIAQESTFTPDVKSAANAYGLMQLLPSTGRHYARTLHLARRFSVRLLTTAETNLRMGMAYFADLVRQFGGAHYALASYNAGENRVARWIAERPGVDQDEFIDDIPFPETRNYVKRILGTAEDYRRLYGGGGAEIDAGQADAEPAVSHKTGRAPAKKASATKKRAPKKAAPRRPAGNKKSGAARKTKHG